MVFTLVIHMHVKDGKDVEDSIRSKLIEASHIYAKDPETISWFVMQDQAESTKWTIVERYEKESSLGIHQANPFFADFGAFIAPLLVTPPQLTKSIELE